MYGSVRRSLEVIDETGPFRALAFCASQSVTRQGVPIRAQAGVASFLVHNKVDQLCFAADTDPPIFLRAASSSTRQVAFAVRSQVNASLCRVER